jgi:3-oxoacyl-(acyl-carrier-protein) synthase
MRRVVVTGLGLVTPLGAEVETVWANILASRSGAGPITRFDPAEHACRIACEVKPKDHEYGFDAYKRVDHKVQRQVAPAARSVPASVACRESRASRWCAATRGRAAFPRISSMAG